MSTAESRSPTSGPQQKPFDIEKIRKMAEPYYLNIAIGALFGFALHRGRVHEVSLIIGQMSFSHFVMLKMFLTAAATSMLAFWALPKFFNTPVNRAPITENFPRGLHGVIIGCSILGVGMTLSGSCPASVYAQVGAGSFGGLVVLLGGLVGAYLFGLYDAYCANHPSFKDYRMEGRLPANQAYLENIIAGGKYTYDQVVFGISGAFFLIVILLELIVNWRSDISSVEPNATFWNATPAIISGFLVGLAQFLSFKTTSKPLGSSSSFSCYIANNCPVPGSPYHQVVNKSHQFQIAAMLGVSLGAALSSLASLRLFVGADISYFRLFLGGIFLIFGGQFAHGCTSGHGMTGLGLLSTYAAVGVASMFGSAILTRVVLAVFGI